MASQISGIACSCRARNTKLACWLLAYCPLGAQGSHPSSTSDSPAAVTAFTHLSKPADSK